MDPFDAPDHEPFPGVVSLTLTADQVHITFIRERDGMQRDLRIHASQIPFLADFRSDFGPLADFGFDNLVESLLRLSTEMPAK